MLSSNNHTCQCSRRFQEDKERIYLQKQSQDNMQKEREVRKQKLEEKEARGKKRGLSI